MRKFIVSIFVALALSSCSNTDSSMSVTTPSSTSVTTTTTSASATSQSEGTTTTTSALESQVPTETQMTTEVSHTEGESSSNTESVSSSTSSEISVSTTSEKSKTEGTKPAVTTTTIVTTPKVTTTPKNSTTTKPKVTTTTKKATTTTKKQTTTTKATTTRVTEITQPKVTTTTTEDDPWIGEYLYIKTNTPLYSKPNQSSNQICTLAGNTKVYIESCEGNWYKVISDKKKLTGYVKTYVIRSTPNGEVNTIEDISLYDDECFKLMNEHRKSLGLPELKYSSELQKAADIRAKELTESFSHFRPNGEYFDSIFEELGIEYDSFRGEINCSGASLPNEAIEAWIDSPAHYQHMISTSYNAAACSHNGYQWIIVFIKE